MPRRVVVAHDLGEVWLALLEDRRVVELAIRPASGRWLGAIVKGRVTGLAPGVRAVFVDIGTARDAFTIRPEAAPGGAPLKPGDELLVQIIREAEGGKGHRATPALSIPGWSLVLAPGATHRGVSHRIAEEAERQRLRAILDEIAPPEHALIARTAAQGASREELATERDALLALWESIRRRADDARAPAIVYREQAPELAFLRDRLADGLDEVIVDGGETSGLQAAFSRITADAPRVVAHDGPLPAIEAWRLDAALEEALDDRVPLPGGGRLVIHPTEALVAIDVNSGQDLGAADLEQTALRTNLEAAGEIVRQVRLRDVGGLVVIDFIDMQLPESRAQVDAALAEQLAFDRARRRVLPLDDFCVALITRQRRGASLFRQFGATCPTCHRGSVLRADALARSLLRELRRAARPYPAPRCRLSAPAAALDDAREIAERWGEVSRLPATSSIEFVEGPPHVEIAGG
ncbi:MAG: ribonuclease E/G [Acidobacteria bacterium]|nr:ribonuclease E/G [Acidobacteriota bacterium]